MRLDQNPIYRKEIIPWYDSEMMCYIIIILMIATFLFGAVGISVAKGHSDYAEAVWMPILMLVLSGGVMVSLAVRLTRRYLKRISE